MFLFKEVQLCPLKVLPTEIHFNMPHPYLLFLSMFSLSVPKLILYYIFQVYFIFLLSQFKNQTCLLETLVYGIISEF